MNEMENRLAKIVIPKLHFWLARKAKQELIEKYLKSIKSVSEIALNLGCGDTLKEGYINCDLFNDNADLMVDLRYLSSKIKNADLIESHHSLEHLSLKESVEALVEWVSVLNPGGYLVITLPDIEAIFKKFLSEDYKNKWDCTIKMIYGSQEHEGMYHKSGFSPDRLDRILTELNVSRQLIFRGYPERPTPSYLYVGVKCR